MDAVAAAGNAGSGGTGDPAGFDDGVVPLTSASLQFYLPGRTRVIPYCHIDGGGIITLFNLCPGSAKGIADIDSATHDSAQIIVSFLNGTRCLAERRHGCGERSVFVGGWRIDCRGACRRRFEPEHRFGNRWLAEARHFIRSPGLTPIMFPAGIVSLNVTSGSTNISASVTLPAGGTEPYTVKPGPLIARVFPAAAANFPLVLAPRMFIAIYGADLADKTAEATGTTFPAQLADAQCWPTACHPALLRFRDSNRRGASRQRVRSDAAHRSKQRRPNTR